MTAVFDLKRLIARLAFGSGARRRVWLRLAAQVRNGLDPMLSLTLYRDRARAANSPLEIVYDEALRNMGAGHSLGASFTGWATPEEIMLIVSGQQSGSGRGAQGLEIAARILESRRQISSALGQALFYPCVLFLFCVFLLFVVSTVVIPQLALMSNPASWQGLSALLYSASSFVASPAGIAVFVVILGAIAAAMLTLPVWTGRMRRYADRFPPWSIYRLTVGSVWLFTVSSLMRSGMQIAYILDEMISNDNTTPWLRERLLVVRQVYGYGKNLGEALYLSNMRFPDSELVDDLRVYATLPGFDERLHSLSRDFLKDGVERIQAQAGIINTFLILLIVAIACVIAQGSMDILLNFVKR